MPTHTSPQCWHVSKSDKNYDAELRLLHHDFITDIEDVANRARAEVIIPFCDRHGLKFDSSMGAYAFFDAEGHEQSSDWEGSSGVPYHPPGGNAPDDYPAVYEALNTVVDRSSLLFEFMEGYEGHGGK